jgi:hypothetical protein
MLGMYVPVPRRSFFSSEFVAALNGATGLTQ